VCCEIRDDLVNSLEQFLTREDATDFPEKRFALQAVGRRVEIMELGEWGERTPQSRLVAIGSSFDAQELSRNFDACLTKS